MLPLLFVLIGVKSVLWVDASEPPGNTAVVRYSHLSPLGRRGTYVVSGNVSASFKKRKLSVSACTNHPMGRCLEIIKGNRQAEEGLKWRNAQNRSALKSRAKASYTYFSRVKIYCTGNQ